MRNLKSSLKFCSNQSSCIVPQSKSVNCQLFSPKECKEIFALFVTNLELYSWRQKVSQIANFLRIFFEKSRHEFQQIDYEYLRRFNVFEGVCDFRMIPGIFSHNEINFHPKD